MSEQIVHCVLCGEDIPAGMIIAHGCQRSTVVDAMNRVALTALAIRREVERAFIRVVARLTAKDG